MIAWMERRQVPLYIAAIAAGVVVGLLLPQIASPAAAAINPVLGLLLFVTFLGVPFGRMGEAFRDWRFLLTVVIVNFAIVPVVVFALTRMIASDPVLLIGALFVLLTPCVDYVIVFTGLAGGSRERLLVAAPLLMFAQMLLLPVYLWVMVGPALVDAVDLAPFVEAFVFLIVIPLVAAAVTQLLAKRTRWGRVVEGVALSAMVPLMMLTLALVVGSQIFQISQEAERLLLVVPVFVLFATVMVPIGALAGRVGRLDVPGRRAIVFSGATRNSLVVLPLVLALPAELALAPLVVVTQTLVELVAMVVFVRLIPRLVRSREPVEPTSV